MYKRNGKIIHRNAGLVADYLDIKRKTPPTRADVGKRVPARPRVKHTYNEFGFLVGSEPRRPVKAKSPFCPKCAQLLFPREVEQGCVRCKTTK